LAETNFRKTILGLIGVEGVFARRPQADEQRMAAVVLLDCFC
jgi:hypothetical protein